MTSIGWAKGAVGNRVRERDPRPGVSDHGIAFAAKVRLAHVGDIRQAGCFANRSQHLRQAIELGESGGIEWRHLHTGPRAAYRPSVRPVRSLWRSVSPFPAGRPPGAGPLPRPPPASPTRWINVDSIGSKGEPSRRALVFGRR